jgi:hypothetical protein
MPSESNSAETDRHATLTCGKVFDAAPEVLDRRNSPVPREMIAEGLDVADAAGGVDLGGECVDRPNSDLARLLGFASQGVGVGQERQP